MSLLKHISTFTKRLFDFNPKGLIFLFVSILIFNSSCKEPDYLDLDVPPPGDPYNLQSIDTFSFEFRTVLDDSVRSDEYTRDVLGRFNDPIFGLTSASVAVNPRLPRLGLSFENLININEAFLTLKYDSLDGYYGNSQAIQSFEVYRLSQRIYRATAYYSTAAIQHDSLIGTFTGTLSGPNNQIRINIDTAFARAFLSSGVFSTEEDFQNFFNGIKIQPAASFQPAIGQGALWYFELEAPESQLTIRYNDTGVVNFPINNQSARINLFNHDFTGTEVQTQLNNPQQHTDYVFVKPFAGTKAYFHLPGLRELARQFPHMVIHQAKFVFEEYDGFPNDNLSPPSRIVLLEAGPDGRNELVLDQFTDYFGGWINPAQNNYNINITRHIQHLVSNYRKDENYNHTGFYIIINPDDPILANRLILSTRDNQFGMGSRLVITYSNLN